MTVCQWELGAESEHLSLSAVCGSLPPAGRFAEGHLASAGPDRGGLAADNSAPDYTPTEDREGGHLS